MKKVLTIFSALGIVSLPVIISSCGREQSQTAKIKDNLICSTDGKLMYKDSGKDVEDEKIKESFHCHGNEVHEASQH